MSYVPVLMSKIMLRGHRPTLQIAYVVISLLNTVSWIEYLCDSYTVFGKILVNK